jgi:type I restriction enzyme S subunit
LEDQELPQLPEHWCWEQLGLLGADLLNPVQTGPFGSKLTKEEFTEMGVPVIAVGNLTQTGFVVDDKYFVSPEKAVELDGYDVQAGDVLFARTGATLGKVCVAPEFVMNWRMSSHILRLRLNTDLMTPELLVLWLYAAPVVKRQIDQHIRGMTRPGFNTTLLANVVVPVPPLAEQHRIVAKVDELMALLDKLEARLRAAKGLQGAFAAAAVHHLETEQDVASLPNRRSPQQASAEAA